MSEKKAIKKFIDSLSDGKLSGWRDKEYTIGDDRKLGYRIDHQGTNDDVTTKKHRLFIQNCKGGKSRYSNLPAKKVLAHIHCDDPEDADKVRDGLKESTDIDGDLVVV